MLPLSKPSAARWAYGTQSPAGYLFAVLGVFAATALLRLLKPFLDAGNESLLYLPIVIGCALRYGFGPAVFASILSFCCWDYFFDVPYYALSISSAHDCISLVIYLVVAVTTAHLAASAKVRTREAEARERETALLYRASSALSCELDTDRSLLTLAEQIIYICRASPCMIYVVDSEHETLETAVSLSASLLTSESEGQIRQITQSAMDTDRLIRVPVQPAASRHNEIYDADSERYSEHPEAGLYVPLNVQQTRVGVLHVGPSFDGMPLSAQDERMIFTLANHAAVVIARQMMGEEAKDQARKTAVLDERNRLARDVHDTLSHAFTGIKFLLEAANRIDSREQTINCIVQARNLAIEGAQEARRSVLALRPAALEEAGNLVDALRTLAVGKSGDRNNGVVFNVHGEQVGIPEAVEENLLRICQEAITNAIKHSAAEKIAVDVYFTPLALTITVEDNGHGFDRTESKSGFGMTSMSERSGLINGQFSIADGADGGTKVSVRVPLTAEIRK